MEGQQLPLSLHSHSVCLVQAERTAASPLPSQSQCVPGTGWKGSSFPSPFTAAVTMCAWYRVERQQLPLSLHSHSDNVCLVLGGRAVAEKVYCSSVSRVCRSCTAPAACVPCVNSLPSLPSGRGWVMQTTKWSVSHSSAVKAKYTLPLFSQFQIYGQFKRKWYNN